MEHPGVVFERSRAGLLCAVWGSGVGLRKAPALRSERRPADVTPPPSLLPPPPLRSGPAGDTNGRDVRGRLGHAPRRLRHRHGHGAGVAPSVVGSGRVRRPPLPLVPVQPRPGDHTGVEPSRTHGLGDETPPDPPLGQPPPPVDAVPGRRGRHARQRPVVDGAHARPPVVPPELGRCQKPDLLGHAAEVVVRVEARGRETRHAAVAGQRAVVAPRQAYRDVRPGLRPGRRDAVRGPPDVFGPETTNGRPRGLAVNRVEDPIAQSSLT